MTNNDEQTRSRGDLTLDLVHYAIVNETDELPDHLFRNEEERAIAESLTGPEISLAASCLLEAASEVAPMDEDAKAAAERMATFFREKWARSN